MNFEPLVFVKICSLVLILFQIMCCCINVINKICMILKISRVDFWNFKIIFFKYFYHNFWMKFFFKKKERWNMGNFALCCDKTQYWCVRRDFTGWWNFWPFQSFSFFCPFFRNFGNNKGKNWKHSTARKKVSFWICRTKK